MGDEESATKVDLNNLMTQMDAMMVVENKKCNSMPSLVGLQVPLLQLRLKPQISHP
jgi:hypothetical protein